MRGPASLRRCLKVGPEGSRERHAKDPITLHDIFFRVGGAGIGGPSEFENQQQRHVWWTTRWIWRADHGKGVGWDLNTSENGLVVNGNMSRSMACLWSIT